MDRNNYAFLVLFAIFCIAALKIPSIPADYESNTSKNSTDKVSPLNFSEDENPGVTVYKVEGNNSSIGGEDGPGVSFQPDPSLNSSKFLN